MSKGGAAPYPNVSELLSPDTELLPDQIGETVFDLIVAGDGCLPAVGWIDVDIVATAVPFQVTPFSGQLPDQVTAIQTSTSISFI